MHPTMSRVYGAFSDIEGFNQFKRQTTLGKLIDESNQTVKNWEARGVSKNALDKMARLYGINPDWVMTGAGEMYLAGLQGGRVVSRYTPVVNMAKVGSFLNGDVDAVVAEMPCPVRHSGNSFGIVLHTEHHGFASGEIVFIDPNETAEMGDCALIEHSNAETVHVLRRVAVDESGKAFYLSLVDDTALPRALYDGDVKVVGRAICAVRRL